MLLLSEAYISDILISLHVYKAETESSVLVDSRIWEA